MAAKKRSTTNNGKTNGKSQSLVALPPPRISPADKTPPASLIPDVIPANRVWFGDVHEQMAAAVLLALGIAPTEARDRRLFGLDLNEVRQGWRATEITPSLRCALVHDGGRTVVAVVECGTTTDVKRNAAIVPFATFHIPQRGELPRDPTLPTTRYLEPELAARVRCCWGVPEGEAIDSAPFPYERFRDSIVAQEIACRCIIAKGPISPSSYLFVSYPTDGVIWCASYLNKAPLTRVYRDPPTWAGAGVDAWNKRSNQEQGKI